MASPPFNLDISDPTDTGIGDAFPSNERAFRDNINSYMNTEHDINTGYHKFQELTTAQKGALNSPPTGMLVYDTTLKSGQINTGTSSSPTWVNFNGRSNFWAQTTSKAANYAMVVGDFATLFNNSGAGGTVILTLPATSTISDGWYVGVMTYNQDTLTVSVNGANGEAFLLPNGTTGQAVSHITFPTSTYEFCIVMFDGANYELVGATANLAKSLGELGPPPAVTTFNTGLGGSLYTGGGTYTITSSNLKITAVGGGGGGGYGGGGGSGGAGIAYLTGLTIGNTLTVSIGAAGGAPGGTGGSTVISSGTQSITTLTATGGIGGGTEYAGSGGPGTATGFAVVIPGMSGTQTSIAGTAAAGGPGYQGILGSYGAGGYGGDPFGVPGPAGGLQGAVLFEGLT